MYIKVVYNEYGNIISNLVLEYQEIRISWYYVILFFYVIRIWHQEQLDKWTILIDAAS
jgi:hypothetical protein